MRPSRMLVLLGAALLALMTNAGNLVLVPGRR